MKRNHSRPALLVRVLTEIGSGRITEGYIHDKQWLVDGYTEGRHIWINPAVAVSETLIHEALHRIEPGWNENYVRRTTTYLLRRMSDEQIQALFDEYQKIAKRRKRRGKRRLQQVNGGDSAAPRQQESRLCRQCGPAEQFQESGAGGGASLEGRAGEVK